MSHKPAPTGVSRSLMKRSPAIAWADAHGWTLRLTKGHHVEGLCPAGCCIVVMGSSPSDHRAPKNEIAMMRRCPAARADRKAS